MLPTRSELHVSRPLTNTSIAYIQSADAFAHTRVFPQCPVLKSTDNYFLFTKDYWFKTEAAIQADGQETVGTHFHVDNRPNYNCKVWGIHQDIGDFMRGNVDAPIDLDKTISQFLTQKQLLRREIEFINSYMKPGTWAGMGAVGTDFTPTPKWDTAGSTPVTDIDVLCSKVLQGTGFKPNKLVIGDNVFRAIKNNASVLDRIKFTQRGLVTTDLLASLFGLDEVIVAQGTVNTSPDGKPANMTFLTGNTFLLCYAAPAPALMWPSAGYIFTWQGLFGGDAMGARVRKIRMEARGADRIESQMAWDMKMVSADLGILGVNVLANP